MPCLSNRSLYDRDYLLEKYQYDPETGKITRKTNDWRNIWKAGHVAGTMDKRGYISIRARSRPILAHRAIWVIVYGEYPYCDIDHVNGDRSDNRLCNLRLATRGQNNVNSGLQCNNTSGYKGAYYDRRRNCWYAEIWVANKKKFLGRFESAEFAGQAYLNAAAEHFGEFVRSPSKGAES